MYRVNGAAIAVHKEFGPGLLESVYHRLLKEELFFREINFVTNSVVPIQYRNLYFETELRCDLLIENILVVELKAVEGILPVHEAQILTYMKLLKVPLGLMLNFNVINLFSQGQKTYVNELYRNLPD